MTERELLEQFRGTPAGQRLLRAIRFAEGTERKGQDPYRIIFGGGSINDLSQHPNRVVDTGGYQSAAAGAYQFMPGTWARQASRLNLKSFGPREQDIAALALARNRLMPIGGLAVLEKEGLSPRVANALAPEWASFPTYSGKSYYGQPVKALGTLQRVYGDAPTTSTASTEAVRQAPSAVKLPRKNFKDIMQGILSNFASKIPGLQSSTGPDESEKYLNLALQLQQSDDPQAQSLAEEYMAQAIASTGSSSTPDPLETVFGAVGEIKNAMEYNQKAAIRETEINNALGVPAESAAPTATGGFVARVGSTGISTGPHLDARWEDGRPISPKDLDRYLTIGNKRPSELPMTSAYGPRKAPAAGASTFHRGVDISAPAGTPIYATGNARLSRSLGDTGGGGYTVEVDTPEGRLQLLHLIRKSSPLSS